MSVVVEPGSLKKTQEELGKYVKKPPLTEKLLNKPPFRFLHDVINAIITETGFLSGLFTDDELSSANIKDKEAKVLFLQKCIDATVLATGEDITVRPSKIVAGHEADKTNEWLQALGRAISNKVDSSEAVSQVLSGAKPDKAKKTDKKPAEKAKEKPDKKPERGKREAPPKTTKPAQVRKPGAGAKPTPQNSRSKPSPNPRGEGRLAVEAKGVAIKDKSPQQSSRGKEKDAKDKTVRKSKDDKGKDEKSRTATRGRTGRERKGKTEDASPEKSKSKSRPASRMEQSKEETEKEKEKENSPPHEVISEAEMIPNGHVTDEEAPLPTFGGSPRPPTAKLEESTEQKGKGEEMEGEKPEGVELGEKIEEKVEGVEVGDKPEGIKEGDKVDEGVDVEGGEDITQPDPSQSPQDIRSAGEEELTNGPTSLLQVDGGDEEPIINDNNNIDPAILKAMAPNSDEPPGDAPSPPPQPPEPPDSGVGSLESPKQPPSQKSAPTPTPQKSAPTPAPPSAPQKTPPTPVPQKGAPTPLPSQRAQPTPGPQPLRAMEQFDDAGGGEDIATPAQPPPVLDQGGTKPERPLTSHRPRTGRRSARPPSARPAPPRVRERREVSKEEQPPRPGTAKPVANVIVGAGVGDDDDDDDNFTVEESKPAVALDEVGVDGTTVGGASAVDGSGEGAGLLVAQILETKKEMEDGRRNAFSPETPGHRRVPIEQTLLSDANRRKEREVIQKDVQTLSGSIQSITRSVNPLAKMLDYLQEDLDSMQKELETWQSENKQLGQTLKREQGATDQSLEPLKSQLVDVENAVQEQRDKLSAIKSNILRNNDKIGRLMAGINLNI